MRCPSCGGEKLQVRETRQAPEGGIRRRRRCAACGHAFSTVETVQSDFVRVRKLGGTVELFDKAKVRRGIVKASVRAHRSDRLAELVNSVADSVSEASREGEVASSEIGTIVIEHLAGFDAVTHVRFAITQLGRQDGELRSGWRDVEDFRAWLLEAYPELAHFRPSTKISEVVKRDGRREPFDIAKLERSIGLASKGRRESDNDVRDFAQSVAQMVERELRQQSLVTSAQLAAEVLRALRQLDDVASIRFASTMKHFASAQDYECEALGLRRPGSALLDSRGHEAPPAGGSR